MIPSRSEYRRGKSVRAGGHSHFFVEAMEERILLSTYTANTFSDLDDPVGSKTISVRDAIRMAADNPGADTISIPAGNYNLSLGELLVNDNTGKVTFQATGGSATFDALEQSLAFEIRVGSTVTMDGLGITAAISGIDTAGVLTMKNCAVYDNIGDYYVAGNGLDNAGSAVLINCTFTGNVLYDNVASYQGIGGGINNSGALSIFDSTISNNDDGQNYVGEGILNSGTMTIGNSIVAGNGQYPDIAGAFTAAGPNLIGGDPQLSPLEIHGGGTETMVPLAGSSVFGAGAVSAIPAGITTDQRGLPRVVNNSVDLGAVQSQHPAAIKLTAPAKLKPLAGGVTSISLGSFTAPSNAGPYYVEVNWGDGTPGNEFVASKTGVIAAQTHNYVQFGTFQTSITMTDGAGDFSNIISFPVSIVGASIVVNSTLDLSDPPGSKTITLADALDLAVVGTTPTAITFDPKVFAAPQVVTVNSAQAFINGPAAYALSVTGPAASLTIGISDQFYISGPTTFTGITLSGLGSSGQVSVSTGVDLTLIDCDVLNVNDSGSYYFDAPISNDGTMLLINCTVTQNAASNDGIISNFGTLTLDGCTVVGNSSDGGGAIDNEGTASIANTIVAGNFAGSSPDDISFQYETIQSLGHNLIGDADSSSGWLSSDLTGTDANPLDPKLGSLGFNGGSTETLVPQTGSPAIAGGDVSLVPSGVKTDQRGFARIVNGRIDIGAVQSENSSVITVKPPARQAVIVNANHTFTAGSFTATPANGPFSVAIAWGDGSTSNFTVASAGSIGSRTHAFSLLGTLTATILVTDNVGNVSSPVNFEVDSTPASSQTIVVNSTKDQRDVIGSATLTLRDAIERADNLNGPVNITFDSNVFAAPQTITLSSPLDIANNVFGNIVIMGPSAALTIKGAAAGTALTIESGINAAVYNLTFNGGGGDAIQNLGTLSITACTIANSQSAGIENDGGMTISASTISKNESVGIYDNGNLTMTNNTVSDNAGGIEMGYDTAQGTLDLTNCTIAGNSTSFAAGGIFGNATITLANTIVADNITLYDNTENDIGTAVNSLGGNLIGVVNIAAAGWVQSDIVGTPDSPINAHLSPLGNFGGPTQTIVPFAGSPAVGGAMVDLLPQNLMSDQRELPRTLNGSIDIGAVQSQAAQVISITPPGTLAAIAGTPVSVPLGSFDPGVGNGPYSVDVAWGDGTPDTVMTLSGTGAIPPIDHWFVRTGNYTASIAVTDSAGDLSNSASFSVNSVAPTVQTIIVNTAQDQTDTPDMGTISLRDAIALADAAFGPVDITFDPVVFATNQTIVLDGSLNPLTIEGNTCPLVSIIAPPSGLTIATPAIYGVLSGLSVMSTASVQGVIFSGERLETGANITNYNTLALTDCNVVDSIEGQGIVNNLGASLTLVDCTISGNAGSNNVIGGAIDNEGSVNVLDCTIDGNSAGNGGGIFNAIGAACTIANTIVAGNSAGATGSDVFGTFTSLGNNFIGNADGSLGWTASDIFGDAANSLDPHLGALDLNGGTTETFIPQPGSPVIDAGSNVLVPTGVTTDQAGNARIENGIVDIGAVETAAPPTPLNFSAALEDRFSNPYPGTIPTLGKIRVTLTNISDARQSGALSITLFAAHDDSTLDGIPLGKAFAERISGVEPKHSAVFNLTLADIPSVPVGNYHILAEVNGMLIGGNDSVIAVGSPLRIQQLDSQSPALHFIDSIESVSRSATVNHRVHVLLEVSDSGNISAKGLLEIDLSLATDAGGDNAMLLATLKESINIAPTGRVRLKLSPTVRPGTPVGKFYIVATVDPQNLFGGGATDTSVGADQITILQSTKRPPKHHAK